jgi:hypothetical protein
MPKGPPIKFNDGDTLELTFTYGNCRRIKSTKGKGYFWGFDCKEGTLTAGKGLVDTIREYWPGRGGSLTITRHSATNFEVVDGVQQESSQYELEQNSWSDAEGGFVAVPWGEDEEDQRSFPLFKHEAVKTTAPHHSGSMTWLDLQGMYIAAFAIAQDVVPKVRDNSGERAMRADIVWKMSFSLVNEALKQKMTPQTIARDLGKEQVRQDQDLEEVPVGDPPPEEEVDGDNLPF